MANDGAHGETRERRRQRRTAVDLPAEIRAPNQPRLECRVRNLCSGGLLLDMGKRESELQLQAGERCQIRFKLPLDDRRRTLQAVIVVVHRVEGGVGARFIHFAADGQMHLERFLSDSGATPPPASATAVASRAQALIEQFSREQLSPLVDDLFATLIDTLWSHSERAENDAQRAHFVGGIGQLGRAFQAGALAQGLSGAVLEGLGGLAVAGRQQPRTTASKTARDGSLELVDPHEFELWLARSELINRLERELAEPLRALRAHLTGVFGEIRVALEPEPLVEALTDALRQAGVEGELLCRTLQLAATPMVQHLETFYLELLQHWHTQGLPEFAPIQPRVTNTAADGDRRAASAPRQPRPDARAAAEAAEPRRQGVGLGKLFQQLTERALGGGEAPAGVAQLLAAQPGAGGSAGLQAPRVREQVDMTDQMLSQILDDPLAPEGIKTLIRRLSIHFLAMAVSSRGGGGVDAAAHPLVELMNQLEELSSFLLNGDADDRVLSGEFEDFVHRLVVTDAGDLDTLRAISAGLHSLRERVGARYRANVSRWVGANEARECERRARERVRRRLQETFGGELVHPLLPQLLDAGWRNLLESVCNYTGIDSARWLRYWGPLWNLHRALRGEYKVDDIPALAGTIYEGLVYIGHDPFGADTLAQQIDTALHQVARGQLGRDHWVAFVGEPPTRSEPEPRDPPEGVEEGDWRAARKTVAELALGSVIWLTESSGERAYRLVWRSENGVRLALSDPMGRRVRTFTPARLAAQLAQGQARVQAPPRRPLMQRAAEATLAELDDQVRGQTVDDALTGLPGQRRLVGVLTGLLTSTTTKPRHLLGFLELDRFELLTATHGYAVGERLLVLIAERLRALLPDAPCLAYLGWNRFALIAPAHDAETALATAEQVRAALESVSVNLQERMLRLSVSLGVALVDTRVESPEHILSAANVACLAAQHAGGGRVVHYVEDDPQIIAQLERMRGWAQAEEAIKTGRKRLRLQPIAAVGEGDAVGPFHHGEILLSVYDANDTLLPLPDFIGAAEAMNLMHEVDRQVIEEALRWLHENPELVRGYGGVAINLSGQSLSDPGLDAFIRAAFERWQVPPGLVGFEVTETAAIVHLDQAVRLLESLQSMGCPISLDDFGSGMSSYGYLKQLPVDFVKIDGSFVKDILDNPHDRAIVKSFNEIAHFMGKETIAEYVENEEILALLRELGVDYVQGYGIARPCFVDELEVPSEARRARA
ncbi:DUF1631 family protein [Marichromatium bheemlicum]|uniref:DUF1631 family protein n=1 Tax=Marichromatium bheemlicum TaxID=365339 RepID=A0ABX1I3F7_9GAMM|nr:DUF1631 family protein [Marichromatium bheemlicum]NKN31638.1 DUF1631 family protein [Marichromatium bheemlicum]